MRAHLLALAMTRSTPRSPATFYSFDENTTGDSGPLARTVAIGGRNEGRWLLSMSTLFAATDANIAKVGGSSLDEIMTPTNFSAKAIGEVRAEIFQPIKVGNDSAIFVGQSGVACAKSAISRTRQTTSPPDPHQAHHNVL